MANESHKAFVVEVLATPSGDLLKALIINKFTDLNIEISKLPLPPGVASSLFGKKPIAPIPPAEPVRKDTGSQIRISSAPKPSMMNLPKFEDIEENHTPPLVAPVPQAPVKEWVTYDEAAALRGTTVASVYTAASTEKWERLRKPGIRGVLLKREDVMRNVKQKEA